jgi:hypothetical protein
VLEHVYTLIMVAAFLLCAWFCVHVVYRLFQGVR